MGEIINYQSYEQYKRELDGELQKTAESFVRIGYLLKVARGTDVLKGSGYDNVVDFAKAEYGLDKTQVSRFISINTRFSIDGCSDRLLPEYQGYGYAKLTIMLQIPEEITQELTPEYTKAEIQAVKEELDEEKKVSDLEVFMEGMEHPQEDESLMKRTLKELGKCEPDLWEKLWNEARKEDGLEKETMELIMAPSGDKNYSVRITGMGRVMLTMKDGEDKVTITNTRTLEKEVYDKAEMRGIWSEILIDAETAGEAYRKTYAEPWPKAEVAPVQQEKQAEPKKEGRVSKAKMPEKPRKPSTQPASKEEKNGEAAGMDEHDDEPGMPDSAGNETPDGGSEGISGVEVQNVHEDDGGKEGKGSGEDHEKLIKDISFAYVVLREAWPITEDYFEYDDLVKELYDDAVKLAAALEKLMMARSTENEE